MTEKEKVKYIIEKLDRIYPDPPIPLSHKDNFTFLVAVILSAQCTDKRVNEVTPHLFAVADTPEKMVQLGVERIERIIRPCGIAPTKARGIYGTSKIILEKHGGEVPSTFEELEALPSVGHKTASVIMSQGFGHPAFPVDTHIHRMMHRWGLSSGKDVVQTEKDAKRLFPRPLWTKLHLQIIYYAREFSPARGHDLEKDIITRALIQGKEL